MKKSDIGIIAIIYAVCLLFLYMTLQLKAAAQVYPLCLISGLAILNTMYLGRCLLKLLKNRNDGKTGLIDDFHAVFSGFKVGQFFFVVISCIIYMIVIRYIGFYLASLLYLAVVMWRLKVKPLPMSLTIIVLGCLIYAVFTLFLNVPLPKGMLFS